MGETWKTEHVMIKPYASMAATHAPIDCMRKSQELYPEEMKDLEGIESIKLVLTKVTFHPCGQKVERPVASVSTQMSCAYVATTQMVDREAMPSQFRSEALE